MNPDLRGHILAILFLLLLLNIFFLILVMWKNPKSFVSLKAARLERRREKDPRVIAQLVELYEEILASLPPSRNPKYYAQVQMNLGYAYYGLLQGDRISNLNKAIACHQRALHFRRPENAPLDYAQIQNNLGLVYFALPTGDRNTNLRQAIVHYQEALRFWTPKRRPRMYALAHLNLGSAYILLLAGDRTANLKQAIAHCQEALRFRTPKVAPVTGYAKIQHNLGLAYSHLPTGDRTTNLKQAITHYREALRFRTPEASPLGYAMTQNNLGLAYYLLSLEDQTTDLNQALTCLHEALRFWTAETTPFYYAMVQNNLGLVYFRLLTGDRDANLKWAITHYQEALRFWTAEDAPLDYATVQYNLGNLYGDLPTEDRITNMKQAIMHYQASLRFRTLEAAPLYCLMTNRGLGNLYFIREEWQPALEAYLKAIEAGEQLYLMGLSSESKEAEIAQSTDIYRYAAFSAIKCGKANEALLILEQGKTKMLVEALRLRVPRPANVPDDIWNAFEHARMSARSALTGADGTATLDEKSDFLQSYTAREQAARAAKVALDDAIAQVRIYAADFLQVVDLAAIQSLLPDSHTVFVTFCITDKGCLGLVVYRNRNQDVQVIEMPYFSRTRLLRLLVELNNSGEVIGGWLGAYAQNTNERTNISLETWKRTIESTLTELGEILIRPIHLTLLPGTKRIIFLPSSQMFLLPLHAAPLSPTKRLCDCYHVSYAPSIEVLAKTQAKEPQVPAPDVYVVINPQEDPELIFTSIEGTAIAGLFTQSQIIEGLAGTIQNVLAGIREHTYVHFSCHGNYDWDEPVQSGLVLTDGSLTLADVQQETNSMSHVRLVTLSACETGIVDIMKGTPEEFVGVPAGFMLAGARCVVSSLWAVPDLSTALLMERFYRNHLIGKMDFAAALQEAQSWVSKLKAGEVAEYVAQCYQQSQREKEKKELLKQTLHYRYLAEQFPALCPFAHPYYWAAFAVNGM